MGVAVVGGDVVGVAVIARLFPAAAVASGVAFAVAVIITATVLAAVAFCCCLFSRDRVWIREIAAVAAVQQQH